MKLLTAGKIDQKEAGKMLAVSVRQIKRILRRYRTSGLLGLISKKRGRTSNRRVDETIRTAAIKLIGEHYRDFGPTLAAEKLAELHEIHLSVESARQTMIAAGYWKPKKGAAICASHARTPCQAWRAGADRRLPARLVRGAGYRHKHAVLDHAINLAGMFKDSL